MAIIYSNFKTKLLIVICLIGLLSPIYGQWQQIGPEGTQVNCFAFNGSNTFAGSSEGVFLTTNNGASWTDVSGNLRFVQALVVVGSNIFAATNSNSNANYPGGVYMSSNNGASWTSVSSGLTNMNIYSLTAKGTDLYAGTAGAGIFKSTNSGSSWSAVNTGLSVLSVKSLAVIGSNIFAGTLFSGLFISSNDGASWSLANTGLSGGIVNRLAVNGTDLYAGTGTAGVFRSTDNGGSWTAVNTGITGSKITGLAGDGTNIFASTDTSGIYLSTNNGSSWTAVNTGLSNTIITAIGINGSNIFAGSNGSTFLSTNNGSSWSTINTGLNNISVTTFSSKGANIFAGSSGGGGFLFSSGTWSNVGLNSSDMTSSVVNGNDIYVGVYGGVKSSDTGVFVSSNNGATWTPINAGLTNGYVTSLAINGNGNVIAGTDGGGVFELSGGTWTSISSGITDPYVWSLSVAGNRVYAGTWFGGVYESTNNGSSWSPLDSVKLAAVNAGNIFAIRVKGNDVFAATYGGDGMFRHRDTAWQAVNQGLIGSPSFRCLGGNGYYTFAGTDSGVYVTNNFGKNWTLMNNGFNVTPDVWALLHVGDTLYAGTNHHSAWRTQLNTNKISGNVSYQGSSVTTGYVKLLGYDTLNRMYVADSVLINGSGNYEFNNVYPGKFVMYAVSDTPTIGTYYNPNLLTCQWDSAEIFSLTLFDTLVNYDIPLMGTVPQSGMGSVDGLVVMGSGYQKKGDPIDGISVSIGKKPGGIILQTETDSAGYYSFSNINSGTYYLYVDIPGLPMDSTYEIVISGASSFTNLNFMADSAMIYLDSSAKVGMEPIVINELQSNIYPNPFTDKCTVEINLDQKSDVLIEALNPIGQVVYKKTIPEQSVGFHKFTFNAASAKIASGVYYISISANNKRSVIKAVIGVD